MGEIAEVSTDIPLTDMTADREGQKHEGKGHGHGFVDLDKGNTLVALLATLILSVHSFIAGLSLGVQGSVNSITPLFLAISSHKWIEAFALGISLYKNNSSFYSSIRLVTIYGLMSPLGIVVGSLVESLLSGEAGKITTAVFVAISGGTFIYVAIVDVVLPEFDTGKHKVWKFISLLFGYGLLTGLLLLFRD